MHAKWFFLENKATRRHRRTLSGIGSPYRSARGQALMEAALSLPLLLLLLVGAVEFARVAYAAIEVSNAASAGAEYGAQNSAAAGDLTGISTASQDDASNISLGTTRASISCICSDGTASTCAPTDCSASHIEQILTVKTQANFTPVIHVVGLPVAFTLTGQAVRKVRQ